MSSVHQLIPKPKFLGYSVSKGGMQNLTRTLALEYAGRGHPRQRHRPGRDRDADQPGVDRRPGEAGDGHEAHPDGRAGDAEEMAAATAFLLSDEAAYITGQTLFVDGGLTLLRRLPRHLVVGMTHSATLGTGGRRDTAPTTRPAP